MALCSTIALVAAIGLSAAVPLSVAEERADEVAWEVVAADHAEISSLRDRSLIPPEIIEPEPAPVVFEGPDGELVTVLRIRAFLEGYGSPMAPFAERIVRAGRREGVDPRVIVAIAGVESTFGKRAPGFNAWGWGRMRWSSWPEAIDEYAAELADGYRSLRTGRFMRASRTYCPPCGDRWGKKARWIFDQI